MAVVNVTEVRVAVMRYGLRFCVAVPAALMAMVLVLHKGFHFLQQPLLAKPEARIVSLVFIAVSLVDVVAAYLLKRRLINAEALQLRFQFHPASFPRQLAAAYTLVFALCAMPAVYGMVCFLLTNDLDTYVLISVICPAAYLLLKPREEEVERLARQIFAPRDDDDIHL